MSTSDLPAINPPRNRIVRLLYNHNPFYLISLAFVLHGTGLWFHNGSGPHSPWLLMGLVGGYILMMAIAAYGIIRIGAVWDDARSILVTILLLFVELALSFDHTVLGDPPTGVALLLAGLAFCACASECLFHGLRIRLGVRYRVPFHLMLVLLFLYPLCFVPVLRASAHEAVSWLIFLFSPIAAVVILTLVPAVRAGSSYVRYNGTPWMWPLFPWVIFGTLIFAFGLRAYAISASFDPVLSLTLPQAMTLTTAFGAYFLVPMVMAVAVLFLESGLANRSTWPRFIGMMLPVVAMWMSLPDLMRVGPYLQFLDTFVSRMGSPLQATVVLCAVFYGYASLRRVAFGAVGTTGALLLLSVVGPATLSLADVEVVRVWPWLVVALIHSVHGIDRRHPIQLAFGLCCGILALRFEWMADWPASLRNGVTLHLLLTTGLVAGLVWDHRLLQRLAAGLMAICCAVLLFAPDPFPAGMPLWFAPVYSSSMVLIGVACGRLVQNQRFYQTAIVSGLLLSAHGGTELWHVIRSLPEWRGIAFYLGGLAWFVLALFISALKAGFGRTRLGQLLRQLPLLLIAPQDHRGS